MQCKSAPRTKAYYCAHAGLRVIYASGVGVSLLVRKCIRPAEEEHGSGAACSCTPVHNAARAPVQWGLPSLPLSLTPLPTIVERADLFAHVPP